MNEKILFIALLTILGIGLVGILFHEKVSEVLEPLKHPISLGVGVTNQADTKPQA